MSLETYTRELSLGRDKPIESFIDRYKDRIWSDEIKTALDRIESEKGSDARREAESSLENTLIREYNTYGRDYFTEKTRLNTATRYFGLGSNVLGGVSAGLGLLGIGGILGLPFTAIGIGALAIGTLANVVADLYDKGRSTRALRGDYESDDKEAPKGLLGKLYHYAIKTPFNYLKKVASGAWEVVSSPFRKSTYQNIRNNLSPISEGVITNAATRYGPLGIAAYLGPALGAVTPYAMLGTIFTGSALAWYRGRRKFDNAVARNVIQRAQSSWLEQYVENFNPVREEQRRPNIVPLDRAYDPLLDDDATYTSFMGRAPGLRMISPEERLRPTGTEG